MKGCAAMFLLLAIADSLALFPSSFHARTFTSRSPRNQISSADLVMRIGKGNSKGMGGMTKGNSIMVNNLVRQKAFKDPNKIFVGNLNFTTTTDDLKNLCKQYGEVAHVKLVKNHYTGNSKGFGFVRFCNPISASSALSALPGTIINGRPVVCDNVEEKEKAKKRKKGSNAVSEEAEGFDLGAVLQSAQGD